MDPNLVMTKKQAWDAFKDRAESLLTRWDKFVQEGKSGNAIRAFMQELNDDYTEMFMKAEEGAE